MLSMVAVAALMGAAVATPHPECEPCAAVAGENLEALANSGKVGGVDAPLCLSRRAGGWVSCTTSRAPRRSDADDDDDEAYKISNTGARATVLFLLPLYEYSTGMCEGFCMQF